MHPDPTFEQLVNLAVGFSRTHRATVTSERFDGGKLWLVAHLTPVYAAVGVLQKAVHGFAVTPEPVAVDLGVLLLWALAALALAQFMLQRSKAVTR